MNLTQVFGKIFKGTFCGSGKLFQNIPQSLASIQAEASRTTQDCAKHMISHLKKKKRFKNSREIVLHTFISLTEIEVSLLSP